MVIAISMDLQRHQITWSSSWRTHVLVGTVGLVAASVHRRLHIPGEKSK
jgi:hypothetical protein